MGSAGVVTRADADIERLGLAIAWGLSKDRPAWQRALALVESEPDRYSSAELLTARQTLLLEPTSSVAGWYAAITAQGVATDDIARFDGNPGGLWQELYYFNDGIFALDSDPLDGFSLSLPSQKQGESPLLLAIQKDGWGIS